MENTSNSTHDFRRTGINHKKTKKHSIESQGGEGGGAKKIKHY